MKRKVLGALLSVAMMATLLVGCGDSGSAPAASTTDGAAAADTAAPAATDTAAPADTAASGGGKKVGVAMPTQ